MIHRPFDVEVQHDFFVLEAVKDSAAFDAGTKVGGAPDSPAELEKPPGMKTLPHRHFLVVTRERERERESTLMWCHSTLPSHNSGFRGTATTIHAFLSRSQESVV